MRTFTPPPRAIRKAKLDNLALVPGSLLPFRKEYQAIANQQPPGTTLVVLPAQDSSQRRTLELVASRLKEKGQRVQILSSQTVTQLRQHEIIGAR